MKEHQWRDLAVSPDSDVKSSLLVIDRGGVQFALVTDSEERLLGVLTDGIVRRAIIGEVPLTASVSSIMHRTPVTVQEGAHLDLEAFMRDKGIFHLPVVDAEGRVKNFYHLLGFPAPEARNNLVVIMAGGLGTRLGEMTRSQPKCMLKINDRPILEHIILQLAKHGFMRFCLCVHHLADKIIDYCGDGAGLGVEISYIRESKRLGTAGALSHLSGRVSSPMVVVNGDVMMLVPWGEILREHEQRRSPATMITTCYEFQVPYGVVYTDEERFITAIEEKPLYAMSISAGLYVLSPEALALVPPDTYFDMPDLFCALLKRGLKPAARQFEGYWIDIGRREDYQRAQSGFTENFAPVNRGCHLDGLDSMEKE